MADIKFSTGLPNCREGRLNPIGSVDAAWMRDVAVYAEKLGYYSLWLNEFLETEPALRQRFDEPPNRFDAIVTMADIAARTSVIRLLPSTVVLPHHHPILLSRQIATLDVFSGGRISLGIGLGGTAEEFRRMRRDLDTPNRGAMMDEFVQALRMLWTESEASYEGKYANFADVQAFPKPLQNPVPIFMAGDAAGVTARIGQWGDGWIDGSIKPDALGSRIRELHEATRANGRDVRLEICRQFYVSLAPSEAEAEENFRASTDVQRSKVQGSAGILPVGDLEIVLKGTSDFIASRLTEYAKAGVTEICAIFYSPDASSARWQMEEFARVVIPAVQRAS